MIFIVITHSLSSRLSELNRIFVSLLSLCYEHFCEKISEVQKEIPSLLNFYRERYRAKCVPTKEFMTR